MNTMIQTEGLCKSYHKNMVVKNLDLSIPEGSIYGFLGPNGAGKSTTMKMLLGLVKPTAGNIRILGKDLEEKNRLMILKQTGSLIESPSYYGHLTGRENLELLAAMKQAPESQIDEVLSIVHLFDASQKKASQYSLGMKQRLGLAGALLGYPKLLLLDEPTNGLDPAGIQEIRSLICTLPEHFGMTVLISSHLLSEMDHIATHVGIIDEGELIFQDTLSTLHENSQKSLLLHTTDNKKAFALLKENGYPISLCQKTLVHNPEELPLRLGALSETKLYHIGQLLYANQIGILRLMEEQRSLEDIFLSLTGRNLS